MKQQKVGIIGREEELAQLESLYASERFAFLVMYGRRRVGKTTILVDFATRHNVIFFSAQEKNDALNLANFSEVVQRYYTDDFVAPFSTWNDALSYLTKQMTKQNHSNRMKKKERTVLIIDEFPFMVSANPAIQSIFQHTLDHEWSNHSMLLVLCGSSVSFMLEDVLGSKSPLYGRVTATREVRPFDYFDSSKFFPNYSVEEKLLAYGVLGGVPRYLLAFRDAKSIEDNISQEIVRNGAFLNDEPEMLLRMEFREPRVYNSILESIAGGHNTSSRIANRIGEERSKVSKYLGSLESIRLVQKVIPCGEPLSKRKGIYVLSDHFYRFWYRYVFSNKGYYDMLGNEAAAKEIMQSLSEYMGLAFETICQEYLVRRAKQRKLPFVPKFIGKWWGNNPATKMQDDVDILALSKNRDEAIFCECKFRSKPLPMEEYEDLLAASHAFPNVKEKHFYLFSKGGFTDSVKERAAREGATLVELDHLFHLE